MILERAIVQQVVYGRDGVPVTREYSRPEHVTAMAQRIHRWKSSGEACQLCLADNAVAVRNGKAMCGLCRANAEIRRAGYDFGKRVQPEYRASSGDGLSGVAIVFDSLSEDLGGWFERIAPAAVDRTLAEGIDLIQLVDHDAAKPIGRLSSGTLRVRKTTRGLANTVPDPPATTVGKDVMISVARRDIRSQSFGFIALEDDWEMENDIIVRTVLDMRVLELSIVTWPAYRATSIEVAEGSAGRDIEWLALKQRNAVAR